MRNSCLEKMTILVLILLMAISCSAIKAQPGPIPYKVEVSCLKEIRAGKKSCWGIVFKFEEAQFKKRVTQGELKVYESKHGQNLTNLMTWHISSDRKRLTIKFKPGTGDFGAGNQAEVTLYKTVFTKPPKNFSDYVIFTHDTDNY